jgi:hypothetical protein
MNEYLDKYIVYWLKQRRFVRNLCRIQILTGGSEIWDREDRNNDSRTPVVSHYLVPTRVGSSGSNYHPVGTKIYSILYIYIYMCKVYAAAVQLLLNSRFQSSSTWRQTTRNNILEDCNIQQHRCGNPKSRLLVKILPGPLKWTARFTVLIQPYENGIGFLAVRDNEM